MSVTLKVNIHHKHNMGLKYSKYIPVYHIMFPFCKLNIKYSGQNCVFSLLSSLVSCAQLFAFPMQRVDQWAEQGIDTFLARTLYSFNFQKIIISWWTGIYYKYFKPILCIWWIFTSKEKQTIQLSLLAGGPV